MDGLVCMKCGATQKVVLHHTSYANDTTVPLCRSCHHKAHASAPGFEDVAPHFDAPRLTSISIWKSTKARLDSVKADPRQSYDETASALVDYFESDQERGGESLRRS